jgi:hypothetical protein
MSIAISTCCPHVTPSSIVPDQGATKLSLPIELQQYIGIGAQSLDPITDFCGEWAASLCAPPD